MASQDYSQPFHGHYTVLDDAEFQVRGRTLFFVVVVFIVILLVVVVLLYSRWVCRYQHFPTSSSFSHAPHAPPPPPQGLNPALIRGLPIVLHQSAGTDLGPDLEAGGGGECCICLGVLEDGEKVKVLPICRHCYHSECVDAWLRAHSSCPLCRASLQTHSQVQPTVVQ